MMGTRHAYVTDNVSGVVVQVIELPEYKTGDEPSHMTMAPDGKIPEIGAIFDGTMFSPAPQTMSRTAAVLVVEQAVERRRQKLSSPLAAKRDHYKLKAELAKRAIDDPTALAMLEGEATARGTTAEDLRDLILMIASQWQQADQALAALEAAAKTAITAAADEDVKGVLDQYIQQIEQVGSV